MQRKWVDRTRVRQRRQGLDASIAGCRSRPRSEGANAFPTLPDDSDWSAHLQHRGARRHRVTASLFVSNLASAPASRLQSEARGRDTGPAEAGPERRDLARRLFQAVSRTFFATAMPIATRIKTTRSFFIRNPSARPVGSCYATARAPATPVCGGKPTAEVNGVWWPPSSSKRVGRVHPVRWVRFLPPPRVSRRWA